MTNSPANNEIFCCYTNQTKQFQVIRISNVPYYFFERTVPPRDKICFKTWSEAKLEIHTGTITSAIYSDVISCQYLA